VSKTAVKSPAPQIAAWPMRSNAPTVQQYLKELNDDRRRAIEAVRKVVLANIDRKKVEEGMHYGMIGYYIPHRIYPKGYHCTPELPLPYICLGSQKNYLSLYMMGIYDGAGEAKAFRDAWIKSGKKLDMGKSCIRFKKAEDLALDVIADTIRKTPIDSYIARYEAVINEPKEVRAARREKAVANKPAAGKSETAKTRAASKKRSAKR
jgi:hypothetical protein